MISKSLAFKQEIPKKNGYILHATLYQQNIREKLIIFCHGGQGDRYEHGRFDRTAEILIENGYNVLLFDFSGFGKNERVPIYISRLISDLEDVWNWAISQKFQKIATIGLSLGALISLYAPLPERKCAVFWAPAFYIKNSIKPVLNFFARMYFKLSSKPMKMKNYGFGPKLLFGKKFFEDVLNLDVDACLSEFAIPTLIVSGDQDTVAKPKLSIKAYETMPQDDKHILKIVDEATHEFDGIYLEEFINHTLTFLKDNL